VKIGVKVAKQRLFQAKFHIDRRILLSLPDDKPEILQSFEFLGVSVPHSHFFTDQGKNLHATVNL